MATTFVSFSEAVAFLFSFSINTFLFSVLGDKNFRDKSIKKSPWTFYDHDKNIHGRFMTMGFLWRKMRFL